MIQNLSKKLDKVMYDDVLNTRCAFCNRKTKLTQGENKPYLCYLHRHDQHNSQLKQGNFKKYYRVYETLFDGQLGTVYKCKHRKSKKTCHVRQIPMFVNQKQNLSGIKFVKSISDYNIQFRSFPHIVPVQERWWEYHIDDSMVRQAKILRKQAAQLDKREKAKKDQLQKEKQQMLKKYADEIIQAENLQVIEQLAQKMDEEREKKMIVPIDEKSVKGVNLYYYYVTLQEQTVTPLDELIENMKTIKDEEQIHTQAFFVMRKIAQSLKRLINKKWHHGNIRPKNIYLTQNKILFSDFNFAWKLPYDKTVASRNEEKTVEYQLYYPPEMIKHPLLSPNEKSDVFCLGLIFYEMHLAGFPSLQEKKVCFQLLVYDKEFDKRFDLDKCEWQGQLILQMTNVESGKRPTIQQLLRSETFQLLEQDLLGNKLINMINFLVPGQQEVEVVPDLLDFDQRTPQLM